MSGDDNTNLESFTREHPRVFGESLTLNMYTVKVSSRSSLPDIPTYKSWGDSRSKKGCIDIIKRNMVNIKAQFRSNIQNRLGYHDTSVLLAVTCLDSACYFVTGMISYILDTHQDLTDSDFFEEASSQLVTQLVNHILLMIWIRSGVL